MTRSILAFVMLLGAATPVAAQWLDYPTPDLPRTADGKPNLTAPTPRTADGKPDLSGLWRLNGLGYSFNIFGNQKVEMLPWDEWGRMAASYAGETGPEYDALMDAVATTCASDDAAAIAARYACEDLAVPPGQI